MSSTPDRIIVDGHVHLRPCFDVISFLKGACNNFDQVGRRFGDEASFVGLVFLTDSAGENGFARLQQEVTRGVEVQELPGVGWQVETTSDSAALVLTSGDDVTLIAVAGQQLVSEEGLEVLAVGTRRQFGRGLSTRALLCEVAGSGAVPIIPWGAGKWLGARRRILERLIGDRELPDFFLGDTGNRPTLWPSPSLFEEAEAHGIRNLPGSDPLPFPSECRRVGSCGFVLRGALDLDDPLQDLKARLSDPAVDIQPFMRTEHPLRFVRNQIAMQVRNVSR